MEWNLRSAIRSTSASLAVLAGELVVRLIELGDGDGPPFKQEQAGQSQGKLIAPTAVVALTVQAIEVAGNCDQSNSHN